MGKRYLPYDDLELRFLDRMFEQPDMLIESRRANLEAREKAELDFDEWMGVYKRLCQSHGVLRLHRIDKYQRWAGAVSLDFSRLAMLDQRPDAPTAAISRRIREVSRLAIWEGRVDVTRPEITGQYQHVSPTWVAHHEFFGVTSVGLRHLGLL